MTGGRADSRGRVERRGRAESRGRVDSRGRIDRRSEKGRGEEGGREKDRELNDLFTTKYKMAVSPTDLPRWLSLTKNKTNKRE